MKTTITTYLWILFSCISCSVSAQSQFLWANHAGGTSDDQGIDLYTDATGNSYVTGNFEGTATFGNIRPVMAIWHIQFHSHPSMGMGKKTSVAVSSAKTSAGIIMTVGSDEAQSS